MAQLLDAASHFLNEGGWRFTHSEDDNWASVYYTGVSGSWMSWFQDRGTSLVAYAVCPVKAPAERWPAVAELIGRANSGLGVGNFEMSFEDGALRFKNGIYAGDEQLSVAMVRHSFYLTNTTMDDYLPAILAVLYGETLPQLAIARVEEGIELRHASLNADPSTTLEALDDESDTTAPPAAEPINAELETLLATLSSGFSQLAESEKQVPAENRIDAESDNASPFDHQADAL
jgi:hypothetical protein